MAVKPQGSKLNHICDDSKSLRRDDATTRRDYVTLSRDYATPRKDLAASRRDFATPRRDFATPRRDYATPTKDYAMPIQNSEKEKSTAALRFEETPALQHLEAEVKKMEITVLPLGETPTRPPIYKKSVTTALMFVDPKELPFDITNKGAKPDPKPLLNDKAPRWDCTKSYSAKQLEVIDPDECFKNNPAMVTEYVEDIFSYLKSLEAKFPIRQNFLKGHETLPWMRASLIDWFVGLQEHLDLYLETLHLSVGIVDRYLQENKDVGHETLQLVGIASLLLASKYEEMYIPDFEDFLCVCNKSFSKAQILTMEKNILRQLDYSFGRPLSVHFLRRYDRVAGVPSNYHSLGKYMLELMLVEYDSSYVDPSLQAAAACCLSMGIMNGVMNLSSLWTPTLVYYTKYEYSELKDLIVSLANILVRSSSSIFQNVRKKYASSYHNKISLNANLNGPLVRLLTKK